MAAPPSQKSRQIGFHLNKIGGMALDLNLAIRPEDLTRSEPSRLAVQQTLGGAWGDAWGAGVRSISLSGHTGWRGGFLMSGEDQFLALRQTVFTEWHKRRTDAAKNGIDPDLVELSFTDALDSITSVVAPKSFQLRRSRARPLLYAYQIQLIELRDVQTAPSLLDKIMAAFSNPLRWLLGVTGLTNIVQQIQYYAEKAMAVYSTIMSGIRTFIATGTSLINSVASMAQQVVGEFDATKSAILNIGQSYSEAGANAFAVLADNPALPAQDRLPIIAIASQFQDAACIMATAFKTKKTYPNYDDLNGASSCSSTAGGDPPSLYTTTLANPFYAVVPSADAPVLATTDAQQAMSLLRADPLLLKAGGTAPIGALLGSAGAGVTVTA